MQLLFDYLKEIRKAALNENIKYKPLKNLSFFYNQALQDEKKLEGELQKQWLRLDQEWANDLNIQDELWIKEDSDYLRLWCLNAWARYQFFVLKNSQQAEKTLLYSLQKSDFLFQVTFKNLDLYKKQFPLIVAHNFCRFSFYLADKNNFLNRSGELRLYLSNQKMQFSSYPDQLNHFLNKNLLPYQKQIGFLSNDYFTAKLDQIGQSGMYDLAD